MADFRVSIRPGQVGAFMRALGKRNRQAIVQGLRRGAQRGLAYMSASSGPTPKDQGILRGAWAVRNTSDGANLVNTAPHAGIVERGSRPHLPPLEPILGWVTRVLRPTENPLKVAEAVRWGIAKKGTKPTFFIRKSIPKLVAFNKEAVEASLLKAAKGGK